MKDCDAVPGDPLAALDAWYGTPLGQGIAHAEVRCVDELLEDCFGYFLLQVGARAAFRTALQDCRIRHRMLLEPAPLSTGGEDGQNPADKCFHGELTRLPFASDSLDAVVLPHSLDFSPHPHQVLREVDRVLIAEGRVLLFGFNPLSTWGMRRVWPRRAGRVPWCGSRLTPFRVCDWLTLIGFHLEVRRMLVFRPPVRRAFTSRLDWIDSLGERYWPLLGGVYAVRAVKRLSAPTPARPSWRPRPSLLPGRAVNPTARESSKS
jgi:SAM-dependent methyltransferase